VNVLFIFHFYLSKIIQNILTAMFLEITLNFIRADSTNVFEDQTRLVYPFHYIVLHCGMIFGKMGCQLVHIEENFGYRAYFAHHGF